MKFIRTTLVSLALAASSYGLVTPRDTSPLPCAGAQIVKTSSIAVGDKAIELKTFSCDGPFRSFATAPGNTGTGSNTGTGTGTGTGTNPNNSFPPAAASSSASTHVGTGPGTAPPAGPSVSSSVGTGPGTVAPPSGSAASSASSVASASSTAGAPASTPTVNVCGEICSTVCANNGVLPPTTDDCQQLVDAVTILNGQISPNFEVLSNHAQTIEFGTCQFSFQNLSPSESMTYCWLSLAQVGSASAAACLPPVQPINSEGICIPSSGLWRMITAHA